MLTLDLVRLDREKAVQIEAVLPPDAELWHDTELSFAGPVRVELEAKLAGSGEAVVRGSVRGTLEQQCRRCLEPVETDVDQKLTLVFTPRDELESPEEEDPEVRLIEPDAPTIDLGEAVREELILEIVPYAVCDPECRGLCPRCGINQNEEECGCEFEEADPRWDVLRALQPE